MLFELLSPTKATAVKKALVAQCSGLTRRRWFLGGNGIES